MSVELTNTHTLIRYISEWDPREAAHTKGGYLEGSISLPPHTGPLSMIIQTYPAEDVEPAIATVHPVLLHIVRIGRGKREQDQEPVPTHYHWRQVFEIWDGQVSVINRTSELDRRPDGSMRSVPARAVITQVTDDNTILLGRKRGQLNLILLQPKQKSRALDGEATVTKVLQDRLNIEDEKSVAAYETYFKGKNSRNLKRVRLKVDFVSESLNMSVVSKQTIVDSGNKDIGAMDFVDAGPLRSCCKGDRLVVVASEYVLSKDIVPVFQMFTMNSSQELEQRPDLEEYLKQPDRVEIRNTAIMFYTPSQPCLTMIKENFQLKLAIKRQGDGYICNKKFDFVYEPHIDGNCLHCDWEVDQPKLPF